MSTEVYHDPECFGFPACDGCGYIDADGDWIAGPTPEADLPYQQERSEGVPSVYYVAVDRDGDEGVIEYDTAEEAIAEAKELHWPAVKAHTYRDGKVTCRYVWPVQAVVPKS